MIQRCGCASHSDCQMDGSRLCDLASSMFAAGLAVGATPAMHRYRMKWLNTKFTNPAKASAFTFPVS
jgi:hypothetical protein